MSPLLAPLFAQLISLQVGDRTEARYVKQSDERFEGSTSPVVALRLTDPRTTFALAYAPSLSLIPLERKPRELYVFHFVSANATYRLFKPTTLSLNTSLGIGSLNFRVLGVQGQPTPTGADGTTTNPPASGTPTNGAPTNGAPTSGAPTSGAPTNGASGMVTPAGVTRPDVSDKKVRYYTFSSSAGVAQQLTKAWGVTAQAGTLWASGRDGESRRLYPPLRGWFLGVGTGYTYALTARDSFATNVGLLKSWSSEGNESATLNGSESWAHRFTLRTVGSLSAGLNITRFSMRDGLRGFSVFPAFSVGISHSERLGRGTLSVAANAFSAPTLEPLRALVDPRVGAGGSIGYSRGNLGLSASGSSAFSIAPSEHDAGAVSAYNGDVRASYLLTKLTQIDGGARLVRQTYQENEVIPITWVAYVGLSFGYVTPLVGKGK